MKHLFIKVKAFESKILDSSALKIIEVAKKLGATVSGLIPLPTKREIYTVLKSVHVNKKSREQFEIRTNKRLIVLKNVNTTLINHLQKLKLPSGVNFEVIIKDGKS